MTRREEHGRILFSDVCGYFDKEDSCDRRGKIAARRVRTLLKFAEHIEVTAPEICDEMKDILKEEEKRKCLRQCGVLEKFWKKI